jgi:hypothetical protein
MLETELRICQRIAKEYNLDVQEVIRIQRSQFKNVAKLIRAYEGKAFALPYLGEFCMLPKKERYLEVCRENNKVEKK